MKKRVMMLLAAACAPLLLSGCLVGPTHGDEERLVTSDWRHRRESPILLDPDFVYRGERYEVAYTPDEYEEQE